MKHLILSCLFLLLCFKIVEAQTNANIPGPENVLVVYNSSSALSDSIKEYYKSARNIPSENIVPLALPRKVINVGDWSDPHVVKLGFDNQNIVDSTWAEVDSISYVAPKFHAWLYFNDRIAKPIANYLTTTYVNGTPLKDIIRFIVLVKGVPFRIDARKEDSESYGTNVICANLLTHLGETVYYEFAL